MDGTPTSADVVIRFATDADAFPISFLLGDLGYPIEPALIVEKAVGGHERRAAARCAPLLHWAWVLSTVGSVRQDSGLIIRNLLR